MEKIDMTQEKRTKIYEVGYLIVPTIIEEQLSSEVQKIKSVIENYGGIFITEDFPKLRLLSYVMRKASDGQKFDKAYFGWIKFEIVRSAVPVIQTELDKNSSILRSMVIATVRENTLYTQRTIFRPTPLTDAAKPEDAPKMTEEEIEKTIEQLVVK